MAEIHRLIETHGRVEAKRLAPEQAHLIDLAARVMSDETGGIGLNYSGLALTGLPHRSIPPGEPWIRSQGNVSLRIDSGDVPKVLNPKTKDDYRPVGIPFGPTARLIVFYLLTKAVKTDCPEVELGRSLHEWLGRMGMTIGGKSYKAVLTQAEMLGTCRMTFHWHDGDRLVGFANETLVKGGLHIRRDTEQGHLFEDRVCLSDTFFRELKRHPVPLWESAIRALAGKSQAMDVYAWLAYRLHALDRPTRVTWPALLAQFGSGSGPLASFKQQFKVPLAQAMAVYREARIEIESDAITLHPSAPPVPERAIGGQLYL